MNPLVKYALKPLIQALKWQDKKLTSLSMRAMKWTGRSPYPIHPKHLYDEHRNIFVHSLMKPDMVFLDIGSGSGSDCLKALQSNAAHVYGVELNAESIALAHTRLKEYGGRYTIFKTNLEDAKIDLPDNSVDLVNFSNVLEHLHNRNSILKELRRILKPDGQLYISIPNKDTPWKKLQRRCDLDSRDDDDHKIEYNKQTLNQELVEAGLSLSTPLHSIIPSLPVNGLISLSAIISPRLYRALQRWKIKFARKNPDHSVGWYFLCEESAASAQAKSDPEHQKSVSV